MLNPPAKGCCIRPVWIDDMAATNELFPAGGCGDRVQGQTELNEGMQVRHGAGELRGTDYIIHVLTCFLDLEIVPHSDRQLGG